MCSAFDGTSLVDERPDHVTLPTVEAPHHFEFEVAIDMSKVDRFMKDLIRRGNGIEHVSDAVRRMVSASFAIFRERKRNAWIQKADSMQIAVKVVARKA